MRLVTTRFWRVLLGGIGVSVCMLLGSQLSTSHAQPPQVAIAQQVQTLKSQGKADDIIPVIIQLQDPITINEGINPTTLDKSVRMRAVAQQTAGFVQRNQAVFRSIKGSTKSTAIVFAQVMRSNLDVLLNDKQIMAVTLDEPQPPSLSESIDMIDSRAAVVAGYDGSGTSVVILDTGVDKNHVFLSGQVIAEACFSSTITINGTSSTSLCPGGVSTSVAPDSGLPCPDTLICCVQLG